MSDTVARSGKPCGRRDQRRASIRWIETVSMASGQPAVGDSGFGLKLLDLTIKSELQGSYTRHQTMGGVSIEIILPSKAFHRTGDR
ncbi:two-component sensor histidine kinase [Mesorhizobium soli]|uniref:hypothetical protein n=1 Tax=Pseudaminobacter soli (ex Li et al. 2025) TaxID=1295366 RepID=UPI002473D188|nr:hypothetical protein [Mesorhizobium soli]MDH6234800.1 two-component sensor histidine kinase [Mesorhizobium soli]